MRMLAYGITVDATNKYYRLGESTIVEALKSSMRAVREVFKPEYVR